MSIAAPIDLAAAAHAGARSSLLAIEYVSDRTFVTYLVAVAVSGVLMLLIAAVGFGASLTPRLFSGVLGLVFLGYGIWVAFIRSNHGVFVLYPVGFVLPILVIGLVLYSRVANREIDAELVAERAKRLADKAAAARAAESDQAPGGTPVT
jgi:hypothetical protein